MNLDSAPANWTALIDDIREGRWISPLNGKKYPPAPYDRIIMEESLRGKEANLVKSLGFQPPFAIVSATNTHNAMGERGARALSTLGPATENILDNPHADIAAARAITQKPADSHSELDRGS